MKQKFLWLCHWKLLVSEPFCFQVCLFVIESVSLCIPITLWIQHFINWLTKFHQISVTGVVQFIDVLIRFWGQRSRSQQALTQKLLWTPYLKNQWRDLHPILVRDVFGFINMLIRFTGQKVKCQGHSRMRHNRRRQPVKLHLVTQRRSVAKSVGCFQRRLFVCLSTR